MAMHSLVSKLKALTPAAARKDMELIYKRPLIDPTKYDSVKELNEALPALLDKRFKAEREAQERYWKAYDRVTYVTAGAGVGGTIWFALWFLGPLFDDDYPRHHGEQQ